MGTANISELLEEIIAEGHRGALLVERVMQAIGVDAQQARGLIASHVGHGWEFDDIPRVRSGRGALARLEDALMVDGRRTREGRASGYALHALAGELADAEDWPGLVEVRDELVRQPARGDHPDEALLPGIGARACARELAGCPVAKYAARVFDTGAAGVKARERVADTHTFEELAALLPDARARGAFAYDRVARGEDLSSVGLAPEAGDLPFVLQEWEPDRYDDSCDEREGLEATMTLHAPLPSPGRPEPPDRVCETLESMCVGWDRSTAVRVGGNALNAIAALRYREAEVWPCSLASCLCEIAQSVAWGGLHYKSLLAQGREAAWALLAAIAGQPLAHAHPDALGVAGASVRWYSFVAERYEYEDYASFQMALETPATGIAWAVSVGDTD